MALIIRAGGLSTPGFLARWQLIDKQDACPLYLKVGKPNEIYCTVSIHINQCMYWPHTKPLPMQSCDGLYVMAKEELTVKLFKLHLFWPTEGSTAYSQPEFKRKKKKEGKKKKKKNSISYWTFITLCLFTKAALQFHVSISLHFFEKITPITKMCLRSSWPPSPDVYISLRSIDLLFD